MSKFELKTINMIYFNCVAQAAVEQTVLGAGNRWGGSVSATASNPHTGFATGGGVNE